ncbi:MAG: penicillin-binding protein 1C [Prevotellaceae bacterium]|nr:penicillin-binding protein 1C [Prevotellaceae bacterium]
MSRHKALNVLLKYKALAILLVLFLFFSFSLPSSLFITPTSSLIEDSTGELLGAHIAADGQWRFPACEKAPEKFAKAIVAFEDRRFYMHPGIDGIAIGRSLVQNIRQKRISQGGSTITMQVIRLMRQQKQRTIKEKLIEAYLAIRMETSYTKDEILALYASHAPFGSNVVGIDAASWRYFGRDANDLSWAEAATLAVLPNSPALIHPGRNRDALLRKRNLLLEDMLAQGIIDEETCELSKNEALPDKPHPLPMHAPHLLDKVSIKYPGKRVSTTILLTLQERVNNIVERYNQDFKANKINSIAVLVLDVETGKTLAYVGNAYDPNDEINGSSVDIITAPRSTGSILKPFLYAAMLDEGELLPNMLIMDIPLYIAGFSPNNYNKTFDGAVPAHRVLERSLNVPSVRMLYDYNIEKFYVLLKKMGMTTLRHHSMHYGLSLILGGAEGTLWDITAIYANMARTVNHYPKYYGEYNMYDWHKAYYLQQQESEYQKTRLSNVPVISAAAIWQTITALAEVNRPEEESSWKVFSSSRRIAWKTGTSYGNRDAWAIGITPDYAVGVWVGNASGEGRPLLTGVGYAAPVLFDIFNLLPNTHRWFNQPFDEMTITPICRKSGHIATNLCTEVDSLWIVNRRLESETCPYHIMVHLSNDMKYRVSSDCYPVNEMVHTSWFVLPPAQEWYYKSKNADYRTLPPIHPNCLHTETRKIMDLIYPANNITIVIPRLLDGSEGKVVFQAAHRRADASIFWHIDDEFVGTTQGTHRLACAPLPGKHTLIIVDEDGNVTQTRFSVENKK